MPAVARADKKDSVFSPNGTGYKCLFPMVTTTGDHTQEKVSAMGEFVVIAGDVVGVHKLPGCSADDPATLNSFSSRVSAKGGKIGRIGDTYGDNIIISGAPRVFCG